MGLLTKEQVKAPQAIRYEDVPDVWGATARIGAMTGERGDYWQRRLMKNRTDGRTMDPKGLSVYLIALCLLDEAGNYLLTVDEKVDEVTEYAADLDKKDRETLDRLYDVAANINGLRNKDVDERAKNS